MADKRIRDLANFSGIPSYSDYIAVDSAGETRRLSLTELPYKMGLITEESGVSLDDLFGTDKAGFYYISNKVPGSPQPYSGLIVLGRGETAWQLLIGASLWYRTRAGNPSVWGPWRMLTGEIVGGVIKPFKINGFSVCATGRAVA